MLKKTLCMVMAVMSLIGMFSVSAVACDKDVSDLPIGYFNIAYGNRYVFFASDGGSYIRPLELPRDTVVNLDNYIPEKPGYTFEGWFSDPRTKEQRVTEVTLSENIVVFAKWEMNDGLSKELIESGVLARVVIGNNVVLQTKNETLVAPVTDLWVQQNARLEALMKLYNEKFNKE